MPTRTREAQPAELDAVAQLTAAVYLREGHGGPDYEPALRDAAGRAATATVLVAVDDAQRLLGAATVATRGGPWAEQAAPGEAVLRMLVVDPAARGAGAGTALVEAAVQRSRQDGCVLLKLSTQHGMHAAHRVYARAGFVRTPTGDWSPVEGLPLLAYALPLAPWCDQCGRAQDDASLVAGSHDPCSRARALDPPRFCPSCRRRMVVQVLPTGWTARCVEHGARTG